MEQAFKEEVWTRVDPEPTGAASIELEEGLIAFHEFCGRRIAEAICSEVLLSPDDSTIQGMRAVIPHILGANTKSRTWSGELHGLISGEIDIDRIDYLMRDSHKAAGSEFGSIDYIRLLDALELHFDPEDEEQNSFRIAPGVRARSAVETLLIQRLQAYEYIHFHSRVVGFNVALRRAFESFLELGDSDQGEEWRADSIRTLFRRLRPNLVYWDTDLIDIQAALGMWQPPNSTTGDDQTSILEPVVDSEQFVSRLKGRDQYLKLVAASVDDGTLLEVLKRAYLLAESAPPRYAEDTATKDRLERFRVYARAALFRRKNFVPAWKSVDEYVDAAVDMKASLLECAPARLLERAEGSTERNADMLRAIAKRMTDAVTESQGPAERIGPLIALNTLMDLILFRPELLGRIREDLNRVPTVGDKEGIWEVSYSGTGPVQPLAVELYAKKRLVSLANRSPLTEAVWLAEERRMKLAIFFFFNDLDFSSPTAGSASTYRHLVRAEVVERLPGVVLELIDEHV